MIDSVLRGGPDIARTMVNGAALTFLVEVLCMELEP